MEIKQLQFVIILTLYYVKVHISINNFYYYFSMTFIKVFKTDTGFV